MNHAEITAAVRASAMLAPSTAERHGVYRMRREPMTPAAAAVAFQAVSMAAIHTTPTHK